MITTTLTRPGRWLTAKFRSACHAPGCHAIIPVGAKIFFLPHSKNARCQKCGDAFSHANLPDRKV